MSTKSKNRKNHKKKVAARNQRLKEQKARTEKFQREFIMNLIKQEQEKGLFENTQTLTDGPVLDGPVLDGPVLDGPILDTPVLDGPILDASVLEVEKTDETIENTVVESDSDSKQD
jgi:hypothetical protein